MRKFSSDWINLFPFNHVQYRVMPFTILPHVIAAAMIRSFNDPEVERIWNGWHSLKRPSDIEQRAFRKLAMLDPAMNLDDLRNPVSNRLHELERDRAGQHSI